MCTTHSVSWQHQVTSFDLKPPKSPCFFLKDLNPTKRIQRVISYISGRSSLNRRFFSRRIFGIQREAGEAAPQPEMWPTIRLFLGGLTIRNHSNNHGSVKNSSQKASLLATNHSFLGNIISFHWTMLERMVSTRMTQDFFFGSEEILESQDAETWKVSPVLQYLLLLV